MVTFSVITSGLSHRASLLFPLQLDQEVKVTHEILTGSRVQSKKTLGGGKTPTVSMQFN